MKNQFLYLTKLLLLSIFFISCTANTETKISGTIDYIGDAEFYLELTPLHYKYSKKNYIPLDPENGNFETNLRLDSPQIIMLVIQDSKYPLYVEPGNDLQIDIERAKFPFDLEVEGSSSELNLAYQNFLIETKGLDALILVEMDKFKVGEKNTALAYSQQKLQSAESNFINTPLSPLYYKVVGEDLVLKLRAVEYSDRHIPDYNTNVERQKVVNEALDKGFFEIESLVAQRAGIRDFTHYYSRTFGIYDSVTTSVGKELSEYDIKQLAYTELNEKRMMIIPFIEDRDAKAYAELFLVAERIGEQPFSISEPTYEAYINEYSEYSEYLEFITYFYNEIKSVSPGQPAIPFSISDRSGNIHTLEDYSGKFILLDFWAGWCQPCLVEFPYMHELYEEYSRDEFEIIGISTEVDSLVWIEDITQFKNPWPELYGGKGTDQETFKGYKGGGIPFYILIDPDGNIARYNDITPSFNLKEVLDSLLLNYENKTASIK
ncbi:MAG: TlpA disulfide reductase family protein [Balneolaceae bacterium]